MPGASSNELLDLPVTRGRLHALAGAGILDQPELQRALTQSGHRPTPASWSDYLYWHALIVGVVLLVAGVIFFVAANWAVFPGPARIAIVGVPMIAATLVGGYLGETLAGRVAGLLGGLLFGPLVAVYGQVYQTGADPWQLFAWWTVVLVAYGALIRFVGTWVLALACLHVACFMWVDQELGGDPHSGAGALMTTGLAAVDGLLVVLTERFVEGREREIVVHTAAYSGLALLLPFGVAAVFGELPDAGGWGLALLGVGLAAIWWFYRWRRPALGLLAGFACVVTILVSAAWVRLVFDNLDSVLWDVAILAALICGQVWGFTLWLLKWRREAPRDDAA